MKALLTVLIFLISTQCFGFELKPHKANYITSGGQENEPVEVKFQLSVKNPVYSDWFWVAYTQKSFWAVTEYSAPFREHNFNPELWTEFGNEKVGKFIVGHQHESTGVAGNDSRGWERSYAQYLATAKDFTVNLMRWHVWPVYAVENPDIVDYQGNFEGSIGYKLRDKVTAKVTGRIKSRLVEVFYDSGDWMIYIQSWAGLGEGLVDYNRYSESLYVGIAVSE